MPTNRSPSPFRRPFRSLLAIAVLALAACGDDAGPVPGSVVVALVSPNGDEGGAVFEVSGETITSADADGGVAFVRQVDGVSRIVVVREPAGPIRFSMEVEDVTRPPTVELVEVAAPDDELRASLAGYGVEVEG